MLTSGSQPRAGLAPQGTGHLMQLVLAGPCSRQGVQPKRPQGMLQWLGQGRCVLPIPAHRDETRLHLGQELLPGSALSRAVPGPCAQGSWRSPRTFAHVLEPWERGGAGRLMLMWRGKAASTLWGARGSLEGGLKWAAQPSSFHTPHCLCCTRMYSRLHAPCPMVLCLILLQALCRGGP